MSQKNICAGVFFNKGSGKGSITKTLQYWCFFVNSGEFLKTVNDYC